MEQLPPSTTGDEPSLPHQPGQVFHPTQPQSSPSLTPPNPQKFEVDKHEAAANFSEAQLETARQAAAATTTSSATTDPVKAAKSLSLTRVLGIAWVIAFMPTIIISFLFSLTMYANVYQAAVTSKPAFIKAGQILDAHSADPGAKPIATLSDTEKQSVENFSTEANSLAPKARSLSAFTTLLSLVMSVVAIFFMKRKGVPKTVSVFILSFLILALGVGIINGLSTANEITNPQMPTDSQNQSLVQTFEDKFNELDTPVEFAASYAGYLLIAAGMSQLTFQLVGHWRNKDQY